MLLESLLSKVSRERRSRESESWARNCVASHNQLARQINFLLFCTRRYTRSRDTAMDYSRFVRASALKVKLFHSKFVVRGKNRLCHPEDPGWLVIDVHWTRQRKTQRLVFLVDRSSSNRMCLFFFFFFFGTKIDSLSFSFQPCSFLLLFEWATLLRVDPTPW